MMGLIKMMFWPLVISKVSSVFALLRGYQIECYGGITAATIIR